MKYVTNLLRGTINCSAHCQNVRSCKIHSKAAKAEIAKRNLYNKNALEIIK